MAQRVDRTIPNDPTALIAEEEYASDDEFPAVVYVTPEGRRMFDEVAWREAGMSGEEFIRRYDAGEYADMVETEANRSIIELALLIPFSRQASE